MKTLILFDIGAVQLEIDYRGLFNAGASVSGMSLEEFKSAYVSSGIENGIMTGAQTTSEFFDKLRKITRKDIPDEELKRVISYSWKDSIKPIIEMKRRLAGNGYLVGNFSNISELAVEVIGSKWPEIFESDEIFPGVYSCRVGAIKPDSRMYEAVGDSHSVIYIDDNESYVRKGMEYGWDGILFTPYIDKSEAVRAAQNFIHENTKGIRVANSVKELEEALKGYGL